MPFQLRQAGPVWPTASRQRPDQSHALYDRRQQSVHEQSLGQLIREGRLPPLQDAVHEFSPQSTSAAVQASPPPHSMWQGPLSEQFRSTS